MKMVKVKPKIEMADVTNPLHRAILFKWIYPGSNWEALEPFWVSMEFHWHIKDSVEIIEKAELMDNYGEFVEKHIPF
jgi:hypothetical protein